MPKLRIEGLERDLDVPKGENLRKACIKGHVNLFWSGWARLFNCRGIGLCGACPVRVIEANGNVPARTKHEARRLAKRPDDWRLACQLEVRGDLRIEPFPMLSVEERLGAEAVRRAKMDDDEREELFRAEREQRIEARRAQVEEFLATRKRRRSRLVGFFMKRLKKDEGDAGPAKKKKEKKGGLASRLKKPGKKGQAEGGEKEATGKREKPAKAKKKSKKGSAPEERSVSEEKQPAKKKGFKLGKGRKKEAPQKGAGDAKGGD